MKLFSLVYFFLSGALFLAALPLLFVFSRKEKYKESIPARFFLFSNPPFKSSDTLWFHVCSLGEARALAPLMKLLESQNLAITTITQTGYNEAKKYNAEVRYLPFEIYLPFWIGKPRVLVVLEAEFWYLLFSVARARGARVILLNARISDRSVKRYLQFAWFYKRLLENVETVFVQSEVDKNRFLALGAKNIVVTGNIKLAGKIEKSKTYTKPQTQLITAASTHDGEELAVLKAFASYKKSHNAKLLVVPRHPERFESVYELMQQFANSEGLSLSRFSQTQSFESDMILCDLMGELNNLYAVSDIAILGGAFREDVGGHNPLEPAFFGCKIITGKHFFHQKELFKYVHHVQYVESQEIEAALLKAQTLPPSMVEEQIDLEPIVQKIVEIK